MDPDCFLVSYPKCGRTWVVLFLQGYLDLISKDGLVFYNEAFYPKVEKNPKIAFIHNDLDYIKGTKTIFMIRDLRDMIVSGYFHYTRRMGNDIDISSYIRKVRVPIFDYYYRWQRLLNTCEHLIIEYEDLHKNTDTWKSVLNFIGIDINNEYVEFIDNACRFENIKEQLESLKDHPQARKFLALENGKITAKPKDPESHKFRRGIIGGYKDYLNQDDIDYIDSWTPQDTKQ